MREQIQARRDELAAQIEEATKTYNKLEDTLREMNRQLCAMHGGLQELDQLLLDSATAIDVPALSNGIEV